MVHVLKILPEYGKEKLQGLKNFEIRKNDRQFAIGDIVQYICPDDEEINFLLSSRTYQICSITDYAQKDGYIVYGEIELPTENQQISIATMAKLMNEAYGNSSPCNYNDWDEFMCVQCTNYCNTNCDKRMQDEQYEKCWEKFIEEKIKIHYINETKHWINKKILMDLYEKGEHEKYEGLVCR